MNTYIYIIYICIIISPYGSKHLRYSQNHSPQPTLPESSGGSKHSVEIHQVYGAEWSYGVYGVACDPPRAETAHVYECSVFVGATATRRRNFLGWGQVLRWAMGVTNSIYICFIGAG